MEEKLGCQGRQLCLWVWGDEGKSWALPGIHGSKTLSEPRGKQPGKANSQELSLRPQCQPIPLLLQPQPCPQLASEVLSTAAEAA